ncbi:hypothetical protein PR202_ga03237 [Eleusine coracana subsp. coracana]|uniref:Rab-GAP TBC domain-containing protein n=1 Tax=Eleusine coracana subsp. coracana TaxID=191504 RepID=A0AAV5BPD1_ELECO|nr:hypothetical protein PR202_ga03237 [Eleusine coracana subsp. coracana]
MNRMMFMACCYNDPEMLIDPDTVYPVRPECRDDTPKSRFKPRPGLTLSPKRWKLLHNEEGCLDIAGMLKRIQRGISIFFFAYYDRLEYEKLKTRCREMDTTVGSGRVLTMPVITEDGQPIEDPNSNGGARPSSVGSEKEANGVPLSKEVIQWKLTLHQIGKDCLLSCLDVNRTDRALVYYESQENLARLWDILAVYSWVDKDIGYCQENLDGGEYLFAFRMLMVLFRREFSFVDTMYLWEILNDITGSLDAKKACRGALQIHEKYLNTVSPLLIHKTWTLVLHAQTLK